MGFDISRGVVIHLAHFGLVGQLSWPTVIRPLSAKLQVPIYASHHGDFGYRFAPTCPIAAKLSRNCDRSEHRETGGETLTEVNDGPHCPSPGGGGPVSFWAKWTAQKKSLPRYANTSASPDSWPDAPAKFRRPSRSRADTARIRTPMIVHPARGHLKEVARIGHVHSSQRGMD